jgi:hypothetical protein
MVLLFMLALLWGCQGSPAPSAGPIAATGSPLTSLAVAGGSPPPASGPTASDGPSGRVFTAITAGSAHTCVIVSDGAVECWGANESGQLGNGSFETPAAAGPVVGLRDRAVAIRAGSNYTCAILIDGSVQCWGDDQVGQLGDGGTANRAAPVDVRGLSGPARGIDTAETGSSLYFHTCVLLTPAAPGPTAAAPATAGPSASVAPDGIDCWANDGLLGIHSTTPVAAHGLGDGISNIVAELGGICVLYHSGTVGCAGREATLFYGDGVPNGLGGGVRAIDSGGADSCAITDGGGVRCWGSNAFGQLGVGTLEVADDVSTVPLDVVGLGSGVASVSIGPDSTCAITDGGGLKCWGNNQFGLLGDGSSTSGHSAVPRDVAGLSSGVTAVAEGDAHACAITDGGTKIKCWGFNDRNELGQALPPPGGFAKQWSLSPIDVVGL